MWTLETSFEREKGRIFINNNWKYTQLNTIYQYFFPVKLFDKMKFTHDIVLRQIKITHSKNSYINIEKLTLEIELSHNLTSIWYLNYWCLFVCSKKCLKFWSKQRSFFPVELFYTTAGRLRKPVINPVHLSNTNVKVNTMNRVVLLSP